MLKSVEQLRLDIKLIESNSSGKQAKPFLKWAGGKTQLLDKIVSYLPGEINSNQLDTYIEPFIGGGAVFFYMAQNFKFKNFIICDLNPELVLTYRVIQNAIDELINSLDLLHNDYHKQDQSFREKMFYEIRNEFNINRKNIDFSDISSQGIQRVAQLLFLNRTCFNGLFRVNSLGEFNVPFGKYSNPLICNQENLYLASKILSGVKIVHGDFEKIKDFVTQKTFVYYDPPYRPLSKTASFNSYSKDSFNDASQSRLADFFRKLHQMNTKQMLSNSDPRNTNINDCFFDDLYKDFTIKRIPARRLINSNASKRGELNELLIMNY